jgi:hypothetical protein
MDKNTEMKGVSSATPTQGAASASSGQVDGPKPAGVATPLAPTPENIAARMAQKLFADRTGHGNSTGVSYRQMNEESLRNVIEASIKLYAELTAPARLERPVDRPQPGPSGSIECPHCHWGFAPSAFQQHLREKH